MGVWLTLTNHVSGIWPVQVDLNEEKYEDFSYGSITLTIDPWVSADTVHRIYRQAQRFVLKKDNRPVDDRMLALADFASYHWGTVKGEKRNWKRELMDEWNERECEANPEWRDDNADSFARDVDRAKKTILGV